MYVLYDSQNKQQLFCLKYLTWVIYEVLVLALMSCLRGHALTHTHTHVHTLFGSQGICLFGVTLEIAANHVAFV
jgi:hypothetical protein